MATILVADDNSNIQKMVSLALQEHGISVVAVGNGEAALRKLPEVHPDVVLADIFMPVRNGYEVCEYIKNDKRFSHVPVILLVGAFEPLDEREARRVGADGILKKPFVPPDPLIAMVNAVLDKSEKSAPVPVAVAEPAPPPRQAAAAPLVALPAEPEPEPLPEEFAVGKGPWSLGGDEAEAFGEPVASPSQATEEEPRSEEPVSEWRRRREAIEDFKYPQFVDKPAEQPSESAVEASTAAEQEVAQPEESFRDNSEHVRMETAPAAEVPPPAVDWMKIMSSEPATATPLSRRFSWETPFSSEPETWKAPAHDEPPREESEPAPSVSEASEEEVASSESAAIESSEALPESLMSPARFLHYRMPEETPPPSPEQQPEAEAPSTFHTDSSEAVAPAEEMQAEFPAEDHQEAEEPVHRASFEEPVHSAPFEQTPAVDEETPVAPQVESHNVPQPADAATVDAVVAKILERLQPQIHDILSQEILRPVVESLLKREIEKK